MYFVGWICFASLILGETIGSVEFEDRKNEDSIKDEQQFNNLIRLISNPLQNSDVQLIQNLQQLSSNSQTAEENIDITPGFVGTRGKKNEVQGTSNSDMGIYQKENNILSEFFSIPNKKQIVPPGFIAVKGRRQIVPPGFVAVRGKRHDIIPGFIVNRERRNDGSVAVLEKRQNLDPGFIASRGRRNNLLPGFVAVRGKKQDDIDPGFIASRGRRDNLLPGFVAVRGKKQDDIDPGFIASRGKRNAIMPSFMVIPERSKKLPSDSIAVYRMENKPSELIKIRKKRQILPFVTTTTSRRKKAEFLFDIPLLLLSKNQNLIDNPNENLEYDFSKRFDEVPPGFVAVRGKKKSEVRYKNIISEDTHCPKVINLLCQWITATRE